MRTAVQYFALLITTAASIALAAPDSTETPPPSYHLHGYYKLIDQEGTWQRSSDSPWEVVKKASWIKPRLVKWGYVPITHDSQNFYCLIDNAPRTGSNITEPRFVCGDPETVEWLFNNNKSPTLRLYGGH